MNRKNRKMAASPDDHFEAVGHLLTQLRTHLTASAEKKGTYGDYLRLLEFYREASDEQAREIFIGWIDNEDTVTRPIGLPLSMRLAARDALKTPESFGK